MPHFYDTTDLSSRGGGGSGEPEGEPREVQAGADDAVVVVRIHAHQVLVLEVKSESLRKGNTMHRQTDVPCGQSRRRKSRTA